MVEQTIPPVISRGTKADPRVLTPSNLLALQRTVGNRAVSRLIQRKLTVGAAHDHFEQEADRVADQVMSSHASAIQVQLSGTPHLQRHSTHEHYLLGSLSAKELASIPMIREQVANAKSGRGRVEEARRGEVLHLIEQELGRLAVFNDKPELEAEQSKEWQTDFIKIPTRDGAVVCTYGEMNTLADMFGNLQDLQNADKKVVVGMLQGVRERVYLVLRGLYQEIGGTQFHKDRGKELPAEAKKVVGTGSTGKSFTGAIGFTGKDSKSGPLGGVLAQREYQKATASSGELEESANAALMRNACHFAPETWKAWEKYHRAARAKALEAREARKNALDTRAERNKVLAARSPRERTEKGFVEPSDPRLTKKYADDLEAHALDLWNEAKLNAGFGDHFLQDAFASGHLIDKTKIMQWFVGWLNGPGRQYKPSMKQGEWAMISTLVEQPLISNPQEMEDVGGSLKQRTRTVGLEVRPEVMLLMWWRKKAQENKSFQTVTAVQVASSEDTPEARNDPRGAKELLKKLVLLGIAAKEQRSVQTAGIRNKFENLRGQGEKETVYTLEQAHIEAIRQGAGSKATYHARTTTASYKQQAREFSYVAFAKFLDQPYVQKITNYLHNKFCVEGLRVYAGNGDDVGTIYGDANMLRAGGHKGVQYSAETAQMARQALQDLLDGRDPPSVEAIKGRFPQSAETSWETTKRMLPLGAWNEALQMECEKDGGLFQQGASESAAKALKKIKKSMVKGQTLTSVEKVLQEAGRPEDPVPAHAPF
ncbi:MAG: hypothetical protein WCF84_16440 [Anaerolineae bacterium]